MTAWRAGFGVGSITAFEPGLCMFGWGHPRNVCEGVEMPLYARALVLEEASTGRRIAYVVCDLGMISESIRQAVSRRLCTAENLLTDHDLMITATHTHSGPGGFSTYLFYAISIPGVSQRVHDEIVDGIVAAVLAALRALRPARAWLHAGWIPVSEPVAFNRSPAAYNRNEDATPVTWERRDEAVDRTMTLLRVEDEHGVPMGMLSWFAVHGTSLHWEQGELHGDNKGHAAQVCEAWGREQGYPGFVALFAQESAGDISPNYRWSDERRLMIGRYDDDHDSTRFNGDVQARHARALFALARTEGSELAGPLEAGIRYRDFFDRPADSRFTRVSDARTAPPRLGIAFSVGTLEGQGPFFALRSIFPLFSRLQAWNMQREAADSWRKPHGPKFPFWDFGRGRNNKILGKLPQVNPALFLFGTDRYVGYYRKAVLKPAAREVSWVPRYLPIQQLRIGQLLIAGMPNEPTTVSGRRLRGALDGAWAGQGVERIVIGAYSNAYCGYLTTPEEYQEQAYEGASTLYGQWSLPVFCTEHVELTRAMLSGEGRSSLGEPPPRIPFDWCLAAEVRRGARVSEQPAR
jgi:neutral ceramidase